MIRSVAVMQNRRLLVVRGDSLVDPDAVPPIALDPGCRWIRALNGGWFLKQREKSDYAIYFAKN